MTDMAAHTTIRVTSRTNTRTRTITIIMNKIIKVIITTIITIMERTIRGTTKSNLIHIKIRQIMVNPIIMDNLVMHSPAMVQELAAQALTMSWRRTSNREKIPQQ